MLKLAIAAGVLLTAIVGTVYGVNKTAKQLKAENDALPEDEQMSQEELDTLLHPAFIHKISTSTVGVVAIAIFKNLQGYIQRWMSYRNTIAISGIILYAIPGLAIPFIAVKACWLILAFDLVIDSFSDICVAMVERKQSAEDVLA